MDLKKRLFEIRNAFESGDTPQATIDVLNGNVDRLLAANVTRNAFSVGDHVPENLTVEKGAGKVALTSLLDKRFLVLTWFRGNW